jgi:hypothetical protein
MAATFADCRALWEEYGQHLLRNGVTARADHLFQEVRARLRQLELVYEEAMSLERKIDGQAVEREPVQSGGNPVRRKHVFTEASLSSSDPKVQAVLSVGDADRLRVYVEAFYYSAHRVRDILRDHKADLPGLLGFEAEGVRNVRNHLVEHTSRGNGVLVPSIACGGPVGPQLRLLRWSLDPPGTQDRGLPANVAEFLSGLQRTIQRAISPDAV